MDQSDDYKIPEDLRRMAEDNVNQTRQLCEQVSKMAHHAGEQVARSQGELAASALEIQSAGWGFAEQNIAAGFDFAARMARARNLDDYFQVQAEFAKAHMEAVNRQTQELSIMVAEAAERTAKAGD